MALQPGPICWLVALVATKRELFVEWSPEEIRTIFAIVCYVRKMTIKQLKAQSKRCSGGGLAGASPVLKGYIGSGKEQPLHTALNNSTKFQRHHPAVFGEQWDESKLEDSNVIYSQLLRFRTNPQSPDFIVPNHFLGLNQDTNGILPGHSPASGATGRFAPGTGGGQNRRKPMLKSHAPPRTNAKSTRTRHPSRKPDLSPTRRAGREARVGKSRGRPPAGSASHFGKSTNSPAPGPSATDTGAANAGAKVAAPPGMAPFDGRAQNYRSTNNDDEDTDDDASKGDDVQEIPNHQSDVDAPENRPSDEPQVQVNALLDDTLKKLKDGTIQATGNAPLFERLKGADMSNVNVVKISNPQDIWNGLMETDARNIQRSTMQEGLNSILLYVKEGGDMEGAQKAHEDAAHVLAHSDKYQQNIDTFVQSCDLASGVYGKKNSDIEAQIEALKYEQEMNNKRLLRVSKNKKIAQGMTGDVGRLDEQARLVKLAFDTRECPFNDEKWTGDEGDEEEGVLAKLFTPERDGKKLFKLPQKVSKRLKDDKLTGTARGLIERFEDKAARTDQSIVESMLGKLGVSDKPKDDDVSMLGMGDALENHEARGSHNVSLHAPVNQNNTAVPDVQQQHPQVPGAHATSSGFPGASARPPPQAPPPPTPGNGVQQTQDQTYPFAATATTSAHGTPEPYQGGTPLNRNGVHHETQQPTREHQTYPNVATNAAAASANAPTQNQSQVSSARGIPLTYASGARAPPNVPSSFPGAGARPPPQAPTLGMNNTGAMGTSQPADASAAPAAPFVSFGAEAPAPAAGGGTTFAFGAGGASSSTPAPAKPPTPSTGFAFGTTPAGGATPAPATGGFGSTPAPAAGGFGLTPAPAPAGGGFSFGNTGQTPAAATPASTFGFGAGSNNTPAAPSTGGFVATPAPAAGGSFPYQTQQQTANANTFSGREAAQQGGNSNGSNAAEYPVQQQRQPLQTSSGGMLDGAMSFLKKLNRKK